MDIPTQDELIAQIERFCATHEMAETTFGRRAVNNPALLRQLRDGKSPLLTTVNKLCDFMADWDAEAATRAKLAAPIEPSSPPGGEEAVELPFSKAPVRPTGASSLTSCSTTAPLPTPAANGSSRCSTSAADADA